MKKGGFQALFDSNEFSQVFSIKEKIVQQGKKAH